MYLNIIAVVKPGVLIATVDNDRKCQKNYQFNNNYCFENKQDGYAGLTHGNGFKKLLNPFQYSIPVFHSTIPFH